MTDVVILGTGLGRVEAAALEDPRFRKASRNMLLALTAAQEALQPVAPDPSRLGFVLASSHGELEMTLSFLKTLAQTGVARPLLFQNSLHNSTAGFVAMNENISGPMLTVSNLHFSGEDALDTASCLLRDGQCEFCLVIGVDVRLPDLGPELELDQVNDQWRREGAAAVLLGTREASRDLKPLGQLVNIERQFEASAKTDHAQPHYDSDAIELLVQQIRERHPAQPLRLSKPNGSASTIVWHP